MQSKSTFSIAGRVALGTLLVLTLSWFVAPAAQAAPTGETPAAGSFLVNTWGELWSDLGADLWAGLSGWLGSDGAEHRLDDRWESHGVGMDPHGEPAPSDAGDDGDHGVGMDPNGAT